MLPVLPPKLPAGAGPQRQDNQQSAPLIHIAGRELSWLAHLPGVQRAAAEACDVAFSGTRIPQLETLVREYLAGRVFDKPLQCELKAGEARGCIIKGRGDVLALSVGCRPYIICAADGGECGEFAVPSHPRATGPEADPILHAVPGCEGRFVGGFANCENDSLLVGSPYANRGDPWTRVPSGHLFTARSILLSADGEYAYIFDFSVPPAATDRGRHVPGSVIAVGVKTRSGTDVGPTSDTSSPGAHSRSVWLPTNSTCVTAVCWNESGDGGHERGVLALGIQTDGHVVERTHLRMAGEPEPSVVAGTDAGPTRFPLQMRLSPSGSSLSFSDLASIRGTRKILVLSLYALSMFELGSDREGFLWYDHGQTCYSLTIDYHSRCAIVDQRNALAIIAIPLDDAWFPPPRCSPACRCAALLQPAGGGAPAAVLSAVDAASDVPGLIAP